MHSKRWLLVPSILLAALLLAFSALAQEPPDILPEDSGETEKAPAEGTGASEGATTDETAASGEAASDDSATTGDAAVEGEGTEPPTERMLSVSNEFPGDIAPTITGLSGLFRTFTTDVGGAHSFRIALHTEIFTASDFLVTNDEHSRFIGNLAVGYTPWKYLEIFLGIKSMANSNERPFEKNRLDQELILALGDFSFGLKGQYTLESIGLGLGANMGLTLLNSVGGVSLDGDSTSFYIGLISTFDLNPLAKFPLRFHFNLGYLLDNSDNLAYFDESYSLASLQVEKFSLGINRSRLQIRLGLDLLLRRWTSIGLTPIVELAADVATGESDKDFDNSRFRTTAGLTDEDIDGTATLWMTLGLRANPIAGLLIDLGTDIGMVSPGYGYGPPVVPWNLIIGLGYAYDPTPKVKEVIKEKVVEKTVEVAPQLGKIRGRVINANTLEPVSGAVVTFPGRDLTGLHTDPDGSFMTYEFPAGKVNIMVRHDEYEEARLAVDIEAGKTGSVEVKLTPATPPVGTISGTVMDAAKGSPIAAKVLVKGPEERQVDVDAGGAFKAQVKPGQYTVEVGAKGYLNKSAGVRLVAGGTAVVDFALSQKPRKSLVQVTAHAIVIKQQVHFATGTAAIKPESRQLLDSVTDALVTNPQIKRVEIQGHTDNRGSQELNTKLSEDRANAVRDYLIKNGIDAGRLTAQGFGPSKPLRPNITARNRALNRRVEFIILEQE